MGVDICVLRKGKPIKAKRSTDGATVTVYKSEYVCRAGDLDPFWAAGDDARDRGRQYQRRVDTAHRAFDAMISDGKVYWTNVHWDTDEPYSSPQEVSVAKSASWYDVEGNDAGGGGVLEKVDGKWMFHPGATIDYDNGDKIVWGFETQEVGRG